MEIPSSSWRSHLTRNSPSHLFCHPPKRQTPDTSPPLLLPISLACQNPLDLLRHLSLRTVAFSSSLIGSLHVESNVLPIDLHKELLGVNALLRPYLLPSSPLRSLLVSEDLANSHGSSPFWVTINCWMWGAWILTFWSSNSRVPFLGLFLLFVFIYSCRSWLKLLTPLLDYDALLWNMHRCTPHLFPSILMGPSLVRVWAVPLFFLILTCSSLFL